MHRWQHRHFATLCQRTTGQRVPATLMRIDAAPPRSREPKLAAPICQARRVGAFWRHRKARQRRYGPPCRDVPRTGKATTTVDDFDLKRTRTTLFGALLDARDRYGRTKPILEDPARQPL